MLFGAHSRALALSVVPILDTSPATRPACFHRCRWLCTPVFVSGRQLMPLKADLLCRLSYCMNIVTVAGADILPAVSVAVTSTVFSPN
jgi:hypothetical protein